jgi:hypothetical protein
MKPGSILLSCFLSSSVHFLYAQDTGSVVQPPKLFQFHGTISLGSTVYYTTGINSRRKPVSWHISGAPHLSVKRMQVPIFAVAGDPDRYYRQPFNQFGLSPRYKWATWHAGYRSLNYSPFTLAGHSFFGAALDVNPGKLRASRNKSMLAVKGQSSIFMQVFASFF